MTNTQSQSSEAPTPLESANKLRHFCQREIFNRRSQTRTKLAKYAVGKEAESQHETLAQMIKTRENSLQALFNNLDTNDQRIVFHRRALSYVEQIDNYTYEKILADYLVMFEEVFFRKPNATEITQLELMAKQAREVILPTRAGVDILIHSYVVRPPKRDALLATVNAEIAD